ncbi:tetratricopeptide repeat protein [Daejeonella sp.]|uniref:tetratricopeptide repeat protein n=1 Tax=Daejeonella sp. TaxID=2805397 RepID=UPI0027310C49|nr:tetratricopeptide repeat protein [Daejeonella sp.]MDP2414987.1 hypothetical protein [Daejeonella sp.]
MKRLIFLITLIFISKSLFAQTKQQIDSLKNVIATTTQDTAKVMALCLLSRYELDNVRKFSIVAKALALARKIKFEKGEAQCYNQLGNYFRITSDYPQSLEYNLKALKIREKDPYTQEYFSSLNDIGLVYSDQQNNEAALAYYFKAEEILGRTKVPYNGLFLFTRIGAIYLRQNKLDSALIYYTKSYEKARKAWKSHLSGPLIGLGNVHNAMGNTELAFSYYRMSIASIADNRLVMLPQSYMGLARLFMKTSNKDSAFYYAKQAMAMHNQRQSKAGVMSAAKLLAQLYENRDGNEAARYYKMALEATDSVFSGSRTVQIQNMSFAEAERQREINESKLKDAEDRKHNLQFAAIAIGLITFIILFFVLSRSIIVKTKFIEFFGVLLLLAVFEFINLFIHPYLAHATDDSPVLMLLILIIIGAMLVPLHHKLEKWITKIMVEKNKKIRLEAARKTIESLEPVLPINAVGKTEQNL